MHAINANLAHTGFSATYLADRRSYPTLPTATIKRESRRKQRRALQAELPALVGSSFEVDNTLDHEMEVHRSDFVFKDYDELVNRYSRNPVEHLVPRSRARMLEAYPRPKMYVSPVTHVQVTRKGPNRRRVTETLKVGGTSRVVFC